MLATVLLHMVEAPLPVDFEINTGAFLNWGGGMVDVTDAYSLDVLDLDGVVDGTVVAWLTTTLGEKDWFERTR